MEPALLTDVASPVTGLQFRETVQVILLGLPQKGPSSNIGLGLIRPTDGHADQWMPAQGPLEGGQINLSALSIVSREFGLPHVAVGRTLYTWDATEPDFLGRIKRYTVVVCRTAAQSLVPQPDSGVAEARLVFGGIDAILATMRHASGVKREQIQHVWSMLHPGDWEPLRSV